jgi:hypothetical protein
MENGLRTKKIKVTLSGVTPILFDKYAGDNKTQLSFLEKVYADEKGFLVLPSLNVMSFLSAQNTESATQRVVGRGYKEVCKAALSYVTIEELNIPFTRDGKPIKANEDVLERHVAVARIMKGKLAVPNPKERPLLKTPWELSFTIDILETPSLREELLKKIFEQGGHAVGIGTFRGVFGKFRVTEWEKG